MGKKKVLVGMSGGVDSAVCVALLLEQGYEVLGATLKIQPLPKSCPKNQNPETPATYNEADAVKLAKQFGIKHYFIDYKENFKNKVIDYFINSYLDGKTPNPCTKCNRLIKFKELTQKAKDLGLDYVATGHYAQVEYDHKTKRYLLKKSVAGSKDQSYVLYDLTQEQLAKVIFPLGKFTKAKIRAKAKELGLFVADKADSQEICFIPDNDYRKFLAENTQQPASTSGNFVDIDGKILGRHNGIVNYTIGQRTGLGIALGYPVYVIKIDKEKNQVILGSDKQLYKDTFYANELNFIAIPKLKESLKVKAKIRSSASAAPATISLEKEDLIKVVFEQAQRAITPGQSVVFYDDEIVIGGGRILAKDL